MSATHGIELLVSPAAIPWRCVVVRRHAWYGLGVRSEEAQRGADSVPYIIPPLEAELCALLDLRTIAGAVPTARPGDKIYPDRVPRLVQLHPQDPARIFPDYFIPSAYVTRVENRADTPGRPFVRYEARSTGPFVRSTIYDGFMPAILVNRDHTALGALADILDEREEPFAPRIRAVVAALLDAKTVSRRAEAEHVAISEILNVFEGFDAP